MPRQNYFRFPVTTLLETEGNIRILRELSLLPESVNADSLAVVTSMQPRGVRIILNRYIRLGIVDAAGKGPTRIYRLSSHPLSQAVRTLFLVEERLHDEELKLIRENLQDRPEVSSGWIYGSDLRDDLAGTNSLDMIVMADTETPSELSNDIRLQLAARNKRLAERLSIAVLTPDNVDFLAGDRLTWFRQTHENAYVIKGSLPSGPANDVDPNTGPAALVRMGPRKQFTRFRRT